MFVTMPICTTGPLALRHIRQAAIILGVDLDECRSKNGTYTVSGTGPEDDVRNLQRLVGEYASDMKAACAPHPKPSLLKRLFG